MKTTEIIDNMINTAGPFGYLKPIIFLSAKMKKALDTELKRNVKTYRKLKVKLL